MLQMVFFTERSRYAKYMHRYPAFRCVTVEFKLEAVLLSMRMMTQPIR
jgi:hypothetical protein